jgi:hypothetical protein
VVFVLVGCVALSLSASGWSQSEPAPLSVNDAQDARPIWSPTRPDNGQAAEPASSTLRLVRDGWGQSRPETVASSNPSALRWRSRTPAEAPVQAHEGAIPLMPANWQGIIDSPSIVQTVAHQQRTDAFQDPFGDRRPPADSRALPGLAPADNAPVDDGPALLLSTLDQLLPPYEEVEPSGMAVQAQDPGLPSLDNLRSAPTSPEAPAPAIRLQQQTQPAPSPTRSKYQPTAPRASNPAAAGEPSRANGAPPPPLATPAPSVDSPAPRPWDRRADADHPRIYNDRDCEREDEKCQAARLALRQNPITNISLDITASFKPDAKTAEEEREAAENQLRRMPSRAWHNRRGEVLAEGRIVDIRNRRIVVLQEDGSRQTIPLGQLGEDETCFLAAWWQVPTECALGDEQFAPRFWQPVAFTWKASALCHKPLYFEERQLERYGHTTGPFTEPVLSGAHFFLNVAVLPYKMGMNPPNECQYPLGYYRPGSCAPRLLPPVPISPRGALFQAGAVTGLVFLLP